MFGFSSSFRWNLVKGGASAADQHNGLFFHQRGKGALESGYGDPGILVNLSPGAFAILFDLAKHGLLIFFQLSHGPVFPELEFYVDSRPWNGSV